jgi:hypothetical protein
MKAAMKNRIQKIKTIVKAFTEPLPIGKDWYEKRMEICNACDKNTKNIPKGGLSFTDEMKKEFAVCPEGDHCTACGCCTHRKASQKTETCGLVELGLEPKWVALELPSKSDSKLTVENITPEMGVLAPQNGLLVYNLGNVSSERVSFTVGLKRKNGLHVKSVDIGCKCTVADVRVISENEQHFDIILSTKDFRPSVNIERTFTVKYFGSKGESLETLVKIKLVKNEL